MLIKISCRLILSLSLFLVGIVGHVNAQCNNQIDIATDCDFLFLLDGTIIEDGFCSKLPESNPVNALTPFCLNLSSSENTGFFLIEPITSDLYLRIKPMNCSEVDIPGQGLFSGMQAAIFSDCSYENLLACSPLCNSNEFVIGADDFNPFQTYLLVFDGCNGSVCDFEIEIQSGVLSKIIPLIDPELESPLEVCSNETSRILVQGLPALTEGNWTLDGVPSFTNLFNGKAVEINNWGSAGTKEICAQISDPQSGEMYFDSCWIVNVIQAPIINQYPEDTLLCFEDQLSLFIDGTNIDNVLWAGPGLSCNGCPNPVLTMPDTSIVIRAIVSNGAGCESKIELPFMLNSDPSCLVSTSNAQDQIHISIAPNPFKEEFTFSLEERSLVEIYDATGRLIYFGKNIAGDQHVDTHSWEPGLYLIRIQNENRFGSAKILKF